MTAKGHDSAAAEQKHLQDIEYDERQSTTVPIPLRKGADEARTGKGLPSRLGGLAWEGQQRCLYAAKANLGIIRKSPQVAILPVILFAVLTIAGELAVHYAALNYTAQRQETALGVAQSAAEQLGSSLNDVLSPLVAIAAAIKVTPDNPTINQKFAYMCDGILKKEDPAGTVTALTLAPWGVYTLQYPLTRGSLPILGLRLLEDPVRLRTVIGSIGKGPDYTDIIGPVPLLGQAKPRLALLAQMYLWLPNVTDPTFGLPTLDQNRPIVYPQFNLTIRNLTRPDRTLCGAACAPRLVNNTNLTFWGFVSGVVTVDTILARLRDVELQGVGYKYVVYKTTDNGTETDVPQAPTFSEADKSQIVFQTNETDVPFLMPEDSPECYSVPMPLVPFQWVVCIAPSSGWEAPWKQPLQIAVPFVAFLVSERRFSMLVKRMLPSKVVRHVSLGQTYAEPFQKVTILFSDIVSYTDMSSTMTPCELVSLLNTIYSHFDSLVDKHGLYKVETIGDAFMCVGGAPDACDPKDAAVRVARMALDMVDFARTYVHKDGRQIQIRVGLYTGDVTAAVIGDKMPHWCLVGDTVNVASRMETNSKPMHVHVGSSTAKLLEGCPEFTLQPRGKINIKGKGLMGTFFVWPTGREKEWLDASMRNSVPQTMLSETMYENSLIASAPSREQSMDINSSFIDIAV